MGTQVEMNKTGQVVAKRTALRGQAVMQVYVTKDVFDALGPFKATSEDGVNGALSDVIESLRGFPAMPLEFVNH